MTDNVWSKLAAPLPKDAVSWRQQGKPRAQGTGYVAPFVAYTDAQVVRDRLDTVVPGEWDLTLDLLPPGSDEDGVVEVAFKARLKVLSVEREDVGTGKDYKQASTDAFKRAAVRFGIGHELYTDYEIVWVRVESDSKYAKALEDPAEVWARKQSGANGSGVKSAGSGIGDTRPATRPEATRETPARQQPAPESPPPGYDTNAVPDRVPECPKCSGPMWDNRLTKRNPKAPNAKCRNRSCDGVLWPNQWPGEDGLANAKRELDLEPVPDDKFPPPLEDGPDGLPF